jgi:hypothetical protein
MTMKTIRIKESFGIHGGRLSSEIQQFRPMPFAETAACQRTACRPSSSRRERQGPDHRYDSDMPLLCALRNEFWLKQHISAAAWRNESS